MPDPVVAAHHALGDAREALAELDAGCCEPGRSPRLQAVNGSIDEAVRRIGMLRPGTDPTPVIDTLEQAGAAIGALQVSCCAPARLPLYARVLEDLSFAQRAAHQAVCERRA